MLKLKNQSNFDTFSSKALNKFFGITVDPSKLKNNKNKNIEPLPIDDKDKEPNTSIWEPFKQTKFDKMDEDKLFAIPVQDSRKSQSSGVCKVLFIRPMNITRDKVEVKFTFNDQTEANLMMSSLGITETKKANWSCVKNNPSKYVYYGVMKNDFRNGFEIAFATVNDSVRGSFKASTDIGEPKSKGSSNFKLSKQSVDLDKGSPSVLYFGKLIYFDKDVKKQDVKMSTYNSLYNEKDDNKLKDLQTTDGDNLYNNLIKKGKDFFGWS